MDIQRDNKDLNDCRLNFLNKGLSKTDLSGVHYAIAPSYALPRDTYVYVLDSHDLEAKVWETYIAYNDEKFFRKTFLDTYISSEMFFGFLVVSKWYLLKRKRNFMEDVIERNLTINMPLLSEILKDLTRISTDYYIGYIADDGSGKQVLDDRLSHRGIYGYFFYERGQKAGMITFNSEFEACWFFLTQLVDYDTGVGFK